MLIHLVARTAIGSHPFSNPVEAWWLWQLLRLYFPEVLAACLMPDHVHLVLDADPVFARSRLTKLLGLAKRLRPVQSWSAVPEPSRVADSRHLCRQIRYVHLNPCRAGLVKDPLAYPWSTHRGVIGAEANAWVPASRLAPWFRKTEGFPRWFHGYVSGDPSAQVAGSPLPMLAPPADRWPVFDPRACRAAALSATLWCEPEIRRRTLVQLARHQGWSNDAGLSELCGVSPRTVRRLARRPLEEQVLAAARFCLGDPRLRLADEVLAPISAARSSRSRRQATALAFGHGPSAVRSGRFGSDRGLCA